MPTVNIPSPLTDITADAYTRLRSVLFASTDEDDDDSFSPATPARRIGHKEEILPHQIVCVGPDTPNGTFVGDDPGESYGPRKSPEYMEVLRLSPEMTEKLGEPHYLCQCACSTLRFVREEDIVSGRAVHCCYDDRFTGGEHKLRKRRSNHVDLRFQVFGDLHVDHEEIHHGDSNTGSSRYWRCTCKCGQSQLVQQNLLTGRAPKKHCDSCRGTRKSSDSVVQKSGRGRRPIDLTGRRFGHLAAICMVAPPSDLADTSSKGAWWEVKCDCGTTVSMRAGQLIHSGTKYCSPRCSLLRAARKQGTSVALNKGALASFRQKLLNRGIDEAFLDSALAELIPGSTAG